MIKFISNLTKEIEAKLLSIERTEKHVIKQAEQSIAVLEQGFMDLKHFVVSYTFPDKKEEIQFFKEIKPKLFCMLIYYRKLYNIEVNRPKGGEEEQRSYLKWQLCRLKDYFERNRDFYKYYRSGSTCLDEHYFLRLRPSLHLTMESFYFERDPLFSTPADFKMAKVMSNDKVEKYLNEELIRMNGGVDMPKEKINWTAKKVFLIELIYLLYWAGVFNHGNATLKGITIYAEKMFSIDLGANLSSSFAEMRGRKKQSPFLNLLNNLCMNKMNKVEEVN